MALEILKVLQKGESNGFHTIKKEILDMESFLDKTETDFRDTFTKLQELNHIISYRDESTNNMQAFRLNVNKDYISFYQKKIDEKSNSESLLNRINELTFEALQRDKDNAALKKQLDETLLKLSEAQHADIPPNAEDRKTNVTWVVVLGVIAAVESLLLLLGVRL